MDKIHYRAALMVSGCLWGSNNAKVFKCLVWMTLGQRRQEKKLVLMYDVENDNCLDTFWKISLNSGILL
jgi:hypothetical protein